jgi:hypothetical protein
VTGAIAAPGWFRTVFVDLARQMRWSFLPPLMIYFAAGGSSLTAIVGTFFVKDFLDLSAAYLAGLAFWAGLPWALKMPLGHLVDLIWRWKSLLIFFGAGLIAASILIMVGLVTENPALAAFAPPETWYVISVLLAPCGYVVQDAVADAMSVDAVPRTHPDGTPVSEADSKALHTTMQTLGRFALISGASAVAALNIFMFAGIDTLPMAEKTGIYAAIYWAALMIPALSISGVLLAALQRWQAGRPAERPGAPVTPNWWYFIGGGAFVAMTLTVGLSDLPASQEIVFAGSLGIVLFLMRQLIQALTPAQARTLVGTAIIIFVFRAVPLAGPGATWFEIDELGFDQQFLSVLSLITALLTLAGIVLLRPLIAGSTIARVVIWLTLAAAVLNLPGIGLYYGLHNWTAAMSGGVVDARFIAILNTAVESPLGQFAMIPMLAWIARSAPDGLKATFFAVMASFTNLALSASSLATKYLNQLFVVTREVRDAAGTVTTHADYSQLGMLLIVVTVITLLAPLLTILIVQNSPLRSTD